MATAQRTSKSVPDVAPSNLVSETINQQVTLEAAEELKVGARGIFTCEARELTITHKTGDRDEVVGSIPCRFAAASAAISCA